MTQTAPAVVVESVGSTTIIRFNRPAERNPLSRHTLAQIEAVLNQISPAIRKIVFTGTDDVFASGAHIREVQELTAAEAREFSLMGQRTCRRIAECEQVSIAAINGYCMGGALDLALACDIRLASSDAVFAHPGVRLGIITGWGGTQRLPRLIGRTNALQVFLTGKRIPASEALRIGLVTGVDDPVLSKALAVRISE